MKSFLERAIPSMLVAAGIAVALAWMIAMHGHPAAVRRLFRVYSERRFDMFMGGPIRTMMIPGKSEAWRAGARAWLASVDASTLGPWVRARFFWTWRGAPMLGAGLALWWTVFSLSRRSSPRREGEVQRGAEVVSARELRKLAKRHGKGDIEIGGVLMPHKLETQHFLVAGATGTGKTVAISRMLCIIRARGDRAVIADSGGLFLSRHLSRDDAILNPFDRRCVPWSPLAEMDGHWDADTIASSVIPEGHGEAEQWHHYARTLASAILRRTWEQSGTNADLHRYACLAQPEEIADLVQGTPAAPLTAASQERFLGSVRAILSSYFAAFEHLDPAAGAAGFSIREHVRQGAGWLFVPYLDAQRKSLRGLIAATLDIGATALLSSSPDPARRLWLVADELPALGTVPSVTDFATRSRKYGGRLLIGLQSVSQLRERYGRDGAQSILSCMGTWLILRASDPETARTMADAIGQREVRRQVQGGQQQAGALGNSSSWSEQVAVEHAVMPSELRRLQDLSGYLSLPGDFPTARVKLTPPPDRPQVAAAFVPRRTDSQSASASQRAPAASGPQAKPGAGPAQAGPKGADTDAPPAIEVRL